MRKADCLLLESAYSSILLKSRLENLTISQLHNVIENASSSELDIIEEALGGFGNLFKAGKQAVQGAGTAVKGAVQGAAQRAGAAVTDAAQRAGAAVTDAAQRAGTAVQGAGRAAKAGAQQVKKM